MGMLGRAAILLGCLERAGGGEAGQPDRRLGFDPLSWKLKKNLFIFQIIL
jgi:hypothetical protein